MLFFRKLRTLIQLQKVYHLPSQEKKNVENTYFTINLHSLSLLQWQSNTWFFFNLAAFHYINYYREKGSKIQFLISFFPPIERDLPVGLDQKIITWELVQKENYLVNLEQERKESNEERLKATSNKYVIMNHIKWTFQVFKFAWDKYSGTVTLIWGDQLERSSSLHEKHDKAASLQ